MADDEMSAATAPGWIWEYRMTTSHFKEWQAGGEGTEEACRRQAKAWISTCFDWGRATDIRYTRLADGYQEVH